MKKKDSKHQRRIKRLIVSSVLCAILLVTSTYAWFIGMKTVNVSSFDVEIAAVDSLSLSLDGKTWSDTVKINKDTYQSASYANNTNSWGGKGLIPMSTVGIINPTSSRLTLFEKGSLNTTPGGYRLMASKVKNEGANEQDGYVAFDLFVKNLSGNEYYKELNVLNEEAIYLTTDSEVKVAEDGGEANTGIENSVRVAFAQIGRVKATADNEATITGITCETQGDVTGICADRPAQIWEPNDTKHVANAINWYNTSCLKRTGDDLTNDASYAGTCEPVADGTAKKTYAVSGVINYSDKVDVYDGADYNGYASSIAAVKDGETVADAAADGKLVSYPYFTDTMKNLQGVNRPTFINLAPNSITKIRVYIYIEGQDVDNYDFASLGRKISVGFGFTKERFFGEDVKYDDTDTAKLPGEVVRTSPTPEIGG